MKVLVLSHMYPRYEGDTYGVFVHEEAREMKRQGIDVKVVAPVPRTPFPLALINRKYRSFYKQPYYKELDGISVYYPRYFTLPRQVRFHKSGHSLAKGVQETVRTVFKAWRFDLIHAHTALPDGFAANLLKKTYQVPTVITIHGADLQQTIDRNERLKQTVSKAMSDCDEVIVVSTKLQALQKQKIGLPDPKVTVLANGVDALFLKESRRAEKNNKLKILSVSNLIETKGVQLNIEAIAKLIDKYPSLHYQIVGTGPYLRELKLLVRDLQLQDHVEFLGKVPRAEVKKYMDDCDVFSLPSWLESFGIVYAEAMACAKPVIACEGEGAKDFITDKQTGFFVKRRDVSSLVDVLDQLLANDELRKKIGVRARAVIEENYTWEHHVFRLAKLYEKL